MNLIDLPNIGKVQAQKLQAAGINTPEELKALGSKEALLRIRLSVDSGACLNSLYGMEGAIRGICRHDLPQEVRQDLQRFFRSL